MFMRHSAHRKNDEYSILLCILVYFAAFDGYAYFFFSIKKSQYQPVHLRNAQMNSYNFFFREALKIEWTKRKSTTTEELAP